MAKIAKKNDKKRGARLQAELERILPEMSNSARAEELGAKQTTLDACLKGRNISDNEFLARLAEKGGNIEWVLRGVSSTDVRRQSHETLVRLIERLVRMNVRWCGYRGWPGLLESLLGTLEFSEQGFESGREVEAYAEYSEARKPGRA